MSLVQIHASTDNLVTKIVMHRDRDSDDVCDFIEELGVLFFDAGDFSEYTDNHSVKDVFEQVSGVGGRDLVMRFKPACKILALSLIHNLRSVYGVKIIDISRSPNGDILYTFDCSSRLTTRNVATFDSQ